jgi:hypothetical protein
MTEAVEIAVTACERAVGRRSWRQTVDVLNIFMFDVCTARGEVIHDQNLRGRTTVPPARL